MSTPLQMKLTPEIVKQMLDNGLIDQTKALLDQTKLELPPWPIFIEHGLIKVSPDSQSWLDRFVTQDVDMVQLKADIKTLSLHKDPVLIVGESGTGKELLARALQGNRRGPFVALNCAGMPEHLIESELFGHVAGAFTDAKVNKPGLMREAQDGTLFLDEIGDLNINVQAKLLRAIQEMSIRPVGANKELPITCRIVAATHHNLAKQVGEKMFRLDLYARLSTFELFTKPLRERLNDVILIADKMDASKKSTNMLVTDGRYTQLSYPFNVRSLEQYIKRFLVLGHVPQICQ